jgi:ribosome maturation factor RimP
MSILEDIKTFFKQQQDSGFFLVDIKSLPADRIMIFADTVKGITIDECSALHRKLVEEIASAGDFEITVSSPGLDEPLKVAEQYNKYIGKNVSVLTLQGQKHIGKLIAFEPGQIKIEEQRKSETIVHSFNLNDVKSTQLSLSFKNHKK